MGYMDWDAIEARKLAEDQAGVRRWSIPDEPVYRGAGGMEAPPDPSENYGLLQYIIDQGRDFVDEMQTPEGLAAIRKRWMAEIPSAGLGLAMPLSVIGPTGKAMGALSKVQEAEMRARRLAQTQDRARRMQADGSVTPSWIEPTGAEVSDTPQFLNPGMKARGAKYLEENPREMPGIEREYDFQPDALSKAIREKNLIQQQIRENPSIDALSLETRMRNKGGDPHTGSSQTMADDLGVPPSTPVSDLDLMLRESPRTQNIRQRNFVLRERGIPYQHELPMTEPRQYGYDPETWYAPGNIMSALGSGLAGGMKAVIEDSPGLQGLLARMPQLPGRAQAFASEHPLGIAGGAAGAAAGYGAARAADQGGSWSVAPPKYVTDPEGANKRASMAEKALQAGSALKQRAQQPWWGISPEELETLWGYLANTARDPFRRG